MPPRATKIGLTVTMLFALSAGLETVADAGADNVIKAVKSESKSGLTTVRVRGTKTPTFTVYKLGKPARVVVEIAGAKLARNLRGSDAVANWSVNSWAVSQVAAKQIDSGGGPMVRIVVGLARAGRYKVRAVGNDVVVRVVPRDPQPAESAAHARATELAREATAARQRLESAESKSQALLAQAKKERADKQRAQALARRAQDEARKARLAEKKARAATEKAKAELARARLLAERKVQEATLRAQEAAARAEREVAAAKKEAAQARTLAETREREASERMAEAGERISAAEAQLRSAKSQRDSAQRDLKRALKTQREAVKEERAAVMQRQRAEEDERKAANLRRELATGSDSDLMRRKAEKAIARAEERRLAAERAAAAAEKRRIAAERAAAAAEKRGSTATAALALAERERSEAEASRLAAETKRKEAERRSERAQKIAGAAEQRAERLKRAAEAAEELARRAQKLRTREETAFARAARARDEAERQRQDALLAARKVRVALSELRSAKRRALSQARAAQTAARELQELEAGGGAANRIADAKRRLEQLEAAHKQAAVKLEERRAELASEKEAAAKLAKRREKAMAEVAALEKAADMARSRRTGEEQKLSELNRAREKAEQALERAVAERAHLAGERKAAEKAIAEARAQRKALAKARAAAERELEQAKQKQKELDADRKEAEQKLAAAERARGKAERELETLKAERAAAEKRLATSQRDLEKARKRRAKAAADAQKASGRDVERRLAEADRELAKARKARIEAEKLRKQLRTQEKKALARRSSANTRVRDVRFVDRANGGRVVIALSGDARARVVEARGRRAVLAIQGAALPKDLQRKLDTARAAGVVRSVATFTHPKRKDEVRVVVSLKRPAREALRREGDRLYWEFGRSVQGEVRAREPQVADAAPRRRTRARSYRPRAVAGYGASSTPITQQTVSQLRRRRVYRGRPIDLDFKDADIHNLLRLLADVGNVNIVVPDDVKASVTVRLKAVPWDQALEVILASKDLWYRKQGKLIRVDNRKDLDAEDRAEAERLAAQVQAEAPEPEIFTLNYTTAQQVVRQMKPLLSRKGRLEVDQRTNSVIVNDVAAHRRRIISLMSRLDTQTPQIQIEARVVEARTNYARQFGIQWGGDVSATQATGNATGLIFPSDISVAGAADDGQTPAGGVAAVPSNFAVNLPAPIGTNTGGGLGLSLGSISGAVNLNLRLTALEDTGTLRIVSSPKISTSNNIKAKIKNGVSIPISVVSANGVQTQFVPADLLLEVTPAVSQRDCSVSLKLKITKNDPDFGNTGARGDPSIITQEAETTVLVGDGETTVVGGVYRRTTGLDYNKVPFFADLPVIGYLFKARSETDTRSETLVFITPKITNRAFLRCE